MPIDLDALPSSVKREYIRLGRRYGSGDTVRQADLTLKAHVRHGAAIAPHGFVAEDALRLVEARDLLVAAGVLREGAVTAKKTTDSAFVEMLERGKTARHRARSILRVTRRVLAEASGADAESAVHEIDGVLDRTGAAGEDPRLLGEQLGTLRAALVRPVTAAAAAARGGADVVTEIDAAARALRDASAAEASTLGTPTETARIDLLDGIVVTLTREARGAARAAARATGIPAIADEFQLEALRPTRRKARPAGPPVTE